MDTIINPGTQQQGLCFLSESTQLILNEIIQNVPMLMAISHLQMRQRHMWTDANRGELMVSQLSKLTYNYICRLAMKITEEISGLSSHNFQMVVEYLYYKCDALRMDFKLPKFLPIFFRTVFVQCKKYLQGIALQPPNRSNQQVPMKTAPTASETHSINHHNNYQQNNYQSITTAGQTSFVQSAPSMNFTSQNSQMCPVNNSTSSNGTPQTNTYQPLQHTGTIWQLNGNNEMLKYQPKQTNQLQAASAVPMQVQHHQQNTNLNPQFRTHFGVCMQSGTIPRNIQYAPKANKATATGQSDYSSINTEQNPNVMQAHNALPVLRSVDVAQTLRNTQQMIETQAINALCVPNSNNFNCASANGYQNKNQTKFVDSYQNNGNAIRNQSKLNDNRSVQLNTYSNLAKLLMTADSAITPSPQPLSIPSNIDRKRSAPSIASTNTIEVAVSPQKMIAIPSNVALKSAISAQQMQPNGDSVSPNTPGISIVNIYENENKFKNESKLRATIPVPAILPAALNESSTDAIKIKCSTANIRLSEPRTLKTFELDAEEEKSSFQETIHSQNVQYEESEDFEILVQTSTETKVKETIGKTEISETSPEEGYQLVDLCESSTDNDLDVAVVETVDGIVSKPKTNPVIFKCLVCMRPAVMICVKCFCHSYCCEKCKDMHTKYHRETCEAFEMEIISELVLKTNVNEIG